MFFGASPHGTDHNHRLVNAALPYILLASYGVAPGYLALSRAVRRSPGTGRGAEGEAGRKELP